MSTLIIMRGLPGSGKTTRARAWVEENRRTRLRVNRDDIRRMLDDGTFEKGVTEPRVLLYRNVLISEGLKAGADVICDDTNLPSRIVRDLAALARHARAGFEVWDMTDVPLETCLDRNSARLDKVPVDTFVITDMYHRFIKGKPTPLPVPFEDLDYSDGLLYIPDTTLPPAWIADIDGTTALKGARDPYDESRVHEDRPNEPVIRVIRCLRATGHRILFVSGRSENCRLATIAWLDEHVGGPFELFMRPADDKRKDWRVKLDLFNEYIRYAYYVLGALDDRNQVVRMWRDVLGLTCMQVADGNF